MSELEEQLKSPKDTDSDYRDIDYKRNCRQIALEQSIKLLLSREPIFTVDMSKVPRSEDINVDKYLKSVREQGISYVQAKQLDELDNLLSNADRIYEWLIKIN